MTASSQERYGDDFGGEQMWGLKELPWPDPVAFVPQTIGWLIVALLVVGLFLWWLRRRRDAWRRDAWRRRALADLDAIAADPARGAELPALLRYGALQVAERPRVASLRGAAWIDWLNESAQQALFLPDDARRLDRLAYGRDDGSADDHYLRLIDCGRKWLRRQHA